MAISITVGKSARKNASKSASKKRLGSPMPRSYKGCGGDEDKMHVFHQFGKPTERCQVCGEMHSTIVAWMEAIAVGGNAGPHPYIDRGIWSMRELRLAMKK
jgi:hypothetical protein